MQEYVKMIDAFGLGENLVYERADVQMAVCDDTVESLLEENPCQNERREQEVLPIAG